MNFTLPTPAQVIADRRKVDVALEKLQRTFDTMKTHELKTDPEVYDAVELGDKTFEIRKDDRGYKVGDWLRLRRTDHTGAQMAAGAPLIYSREIQVYVSHILRGPVYGLQDGWVIMSIKPVLV